VHRPTWPSANSIQFKTFVHQDFYSTHFGTFVGLSNPHISKTTNFIFSQNYTVVHRQPWPCARPSELKTFVHQEFNDILFGDICRTFQPSHLKNHEFHFFTKLPTKPSSYAVVHRQPSPCAKPTELKTSVYQDFHGIHLGEFGGQSNPHISKTTNFIFFTKLHTKPSS